MEVMRRTVLGRRKRGAVLVTGGGRGIGRGIALELAAGGFDVAVNYRGNREAAQRTVRECFQRAPGGGRFAALGADISRAEDRRRLIEETLEVFGGIHSLVNNAGIAPGDRRDMTEAGEESFDEIMGTNLKGPYFLTQAVVREWLSEEGVEDGRGSTGERGPKVRGRCIVFVTSVSAVSASVNRGDYCVSKAALSMAARLWALRLAAEGIGVYELRPGIMETDMTAGVRERYDALIAEGLVPRGRWGRPEDAGRAVRGLLGGDFEFSTGTVIHSDGGLHIPRL